MSSCLSSDIKTRIIDDIEKLIFLRSLAFLQPFFFNIFIFCLNHLKRMNGDDDEDVHDDGQHHVRELRIKKRREVKKTHQNDSDLRMKCGLTTTLLTFKSELSLMMTAKKIWLCLGYESKAAKKKKPGTGIRWVGDITTCLGFHWSHHSHCTHKKIISSSWLSVKTEKRGLLSSHFKLFFDQCDAFEGECYASENFESQLDTNMTIKTIDYRFVSREIVWNDRKFS